ncbi:5398_t:CDS:2 [Paraglomus occultum]|uniref:5398_t:CDS:1 n=1 Tax=Paraglomus occultum TaxID=144539 RepID=A0A9N9FRB5_9GLOM|nr:5398_t:CDS:2 [Paraglomus occultum]
MPLIEIPKDVFIRLKPEIETASQGILFGVREECLDRGLIVHVKGFLPYRSSSDLVNAIAKFIRWKGNTVLGWYVAPTPDIVDRHEPTHIASSYFRTFQAAMLKVITANYIPNHTDNSVSSDNNGNVNDKSTVSELASPTPNPSPFASDDPTASHSKQTPLTHTPSPQPHPSLSSPASTTDIHSDAQPTATGYDLSQIATGRRLVSRRASTTDMDRVKLSRNDWGRKGEGVSKGKRKKDDNNNVGSIKKARTNHGDCVIPVPLTIISGQGSEYLHNSFIEHSLYTSQISPIDLSPQISSFFSYYSPTAFSRTSPQTYPTYSHHYDHAYTFSPSSSPTSNFPPTTLPPAVSSVNTGPLHHRLHSTLSAITSHLTTHTQEKIRLYEKSCQEYELLLEILEGLGPEEDDDNFADKDNFENAREQESNLRSQLSTPTGITDVVMTDANEIIDNENNSPLPSKHPPESKSQTTVSTPPIELIEIMDENDMSTINVNPSILLTSSINHANASNNSQQSVTEDKLTESSPEDGEIADDSESNEEKQSVDKETEETIGQTEEKMQAQKEKDIDGKGEKDLTEEERDTDKDVKQEEEGEQKGTGMTETKQDEENKIESVKVKDDASEWAWDEEDIG